MYVFFALLLLGILIVAHEAGHFWASRACGIEVQEFSIGMGPKLFEKTGKRGTRFTLRLLPIGGFCQFYAEDEKNPDARAFNKQRIWKRALTVTGGPLTNFLVAFLAIVVYLSGIGLNAVIPRVASVEENAARAGLMERDVFISVNGKKVEDAGTVIEEVSASEGREVTLLVRRGREEKELVIAPFFDEEAQRWLVGFTFDVGRVRMPLSESMPFSVSYNAESATLIARALGGIVTKGEGVEDVTGPVGTVYMIEEATRRGGIDVYMELLALISVNLGIMNLLPVPGLDGSKLLFLLMEGIRRKPANQELEGMIHLIGFALLFGLMLLLTYKDIVTFFVR